jgi:hypothetical protein
MEPPFDYTDDDSGDEPLPMDALAQDGSRPGRDGVEREWLIFFFMAR